MDNGVVEASEEHGFGFRLKGRLAIWEKICRSIIAGAVWFEGVSYYSWLRFTSIVRFFSVSWPIGGFFSMFLVSFLL